MIGSRIMREQQTVSRMIELYCKSHHGTEICDSCQQLIHYAHKRLTHCRFGEQKTTCEKCPIHCYKPIMREQIKSVMRYAGPRMLLHHPMMAVRHLLDGMRKAPELPVRKKRTDTSTKQEL